MVRSGAIDLFAASRLTGWPWECPTSRPWEGCTETCSALLPRRPSLSPTQVDLSAATVLDPRSTARARGRGIAHLTSSDTLGSKSMLRASASFIPSRTDFQALANSSVGGNGLPRPYGRFLAAREGNGLAVWERLPPYQPAPLRSGPLPEGEPDGRNVTQINVEQGRLLQRNLNHDTVSIDSSYVASGKDVLENWPDDLKRVDKFARPRPHVEALANPLAGYREGVDYSLNPPSGATFLVRVPEMPPTVKVDSSSEFERSFLHPLRGHSKGTIRGGRAHKSRVAHMLPPAPGAAS